MTDYDYEMYTSGMKLKRKGKLKNIESVNFFEGDTYLNIEDSEECGLSFGGVILPDSIGNNIEVWENTKRCRRPWKVIYDKDLKRVYVSK